MVVGPEYWSTSSKEVDPEARSTSGTIHHDGTAFPTHFISGIWSISSLPSFKKQKRQHSLLKVHLTFLSSRLLPSSRTVVPFFCSKYWKKTNLLQQLHVFAFALFCCLTLLRIQSQLSICFLSRNAAWWRKNKENSLSYRFDLLQTSLINIFWEYLFLHNVSEKKITLVS